ncbi:MAG TPA: VTT domain-containing protein [Acidobacteriaceae bacterium]|jgi:membrane protein YqaA with SNARE-associated domain
MRTLFQSSLAGARAFALVQAAQHAGSVHHHHTLVTFFFHLGMVGLFLVSVVDSSFVPLPIPGVTDVMIVVYAAQHANVILLVLIATLGSAAGGLFSHAVGQAGGLGFLQKHVRPALLTRITRWVEKHAILAVAVPAILPPPMPLSPFVLVAGAVHMSRRKFMTAFTASRFLRHALAAWLGVHYGRQVLHIWTAFTDRWGTPILIVLWTVILLFTGIGIWRLYRSSRGMNLQGTQRLPHTLEQTP